MITAGIQLDTLKSGFLNVVFKRESAVNTKVSELTMEVGLVCNRILLEDVLPNSGSSFRPFKWNIFKDERICAYHYAI